MKRNIILISVATYWLANLGCTKMDTREPLVVTDKPDKITNVTVENHRGYALIDYQLPNNEHLQYIMAEYKINSSTTRQAKASVSLNQIRVEGFEDKGAYEVLVYAVGKGEVKSDPVTVVVNPDTPPYLAVRESLRMVNGFGGISVLFENSDAADVAIGVVTRNDNDELYTANSLYTSLTGGSFATRGFAPEERTFGVYVRDKYNNYSDTLFGDFLPLLERQLDKSKFSEYVLPYDTPVGHGWVRTRLWDNDLNTGFHTPEPTEPMPAYVTIDLGVTATLSRFKLWQRQQQFFYAHGNPREWTMWGSTDPNPDGSMDDSWIHLMDCESIKPSGEGEVTAADIAYASAGEEFELPPDTPPVRYIRMELKRSWSNSARFHIMELTFWGNDD